MNEVAKKHVIHTYLLLKITYGLGAIVVGVDKFLDYITNWNQYVSPQISSIIPLSTQHFLYGVGIIEIIVGVLILSKLTKIGAYIMAAWMFIIALNLTLLGMYDIALRDVVIGISALGLACLTEAACQCEIK